MAVSIVQIRRRLKAEDFVGLFIDVLGWDRIPAAPAVVQLEDAEYELQPIAQKRGAVIFVTHGIPDRLTRVRIERAVAKIHFEHIIAYADPETYDQLWQWARRDPGRNVSLKEHWFRSGQSGEALAERIAGLHVSLDEEPDLTLPAVTSRMRRSFDAERVTRAFYERFKQEHVAFLGFIEGMPDADSRQWYGSLMLNRLMFTYFIQKKGLLDGDVDYLRNRLRAVRQVGRDKFLSFYRHFLLRLFHEGFGQPHHSPNPPLDSVLGAVPYLNGGLFEIHELELQYPNIEIADDIFERVFDFFDSYVWHLDDRPLRTDREINPDVLGYIFEKYINQKEMGAYYTKEDVTGFMTEQTVLARLMELAQERCPVAFRNDGAIWSLLRDDPRRYVHDALLYGTEVALPDDIAAGIITPAERAKWAEPAGGHSLTNETWREHVERRRHAEQLLDELHLGQVASVGALQVRNLQLSQLVLDAISYAEGPEVVRAFYLSLQSLRILDPACGSGAFLFAALTLLVPLYEACVDRMRAFCEDPGSIPISTLRDFQETLDEIEGHPSPSYFTLKTVIVNNLYGVDLMKEATEICKLRLFLRLVAEVEELAELEPLPDIDFNIRSGNSLVGFTRSSELVGMVADRLDFNDEGASLIARAEAADRQFDLYRSAQLSGDRPHTWAAEKDALKDALRSFRDELDAYLGELYGTSPAHEQEYSDWRERHSPFHWLVEFHSIMAAGGFDVVLGNPPWKEYSAVRRHYSVLGYKTERGGNLYGLFTERALQLRARDGMASFIVQLPLGCSTRMATVRGELRSSPGALLTAHFDDRPGRLFEGLEHCRSVIFIKGGSETGQALWTTRYHRWYTEARPYLMSALEYVEVTPTGLFPDRFPKLGHKVAADIFAKVRRASNLNLSTAMRAVATSAFVFYQEATGYWVKASAGLPYYSKNGVAGAPAHGRYLYFDSEVAAASASALLNSSLFYIYFLGYADCFHLSGEIVSNFPITSDMLLNAELSGKGRALMADLSEKAETRSITTRDGDRIEYAEYFGWRSKKLIDDIDECLGKMYGLSAEELDFVINYDLRFRMGDES